MSLTRCLIIDDEPYARQKIAKFLESEQDMAVVGECGNGPEAVKAIRAQRPDLIFLDIQMPDMDGFGVLRALPADLQPLVIFVTAYDRYAIAAFEVRALDYLLKPFDRTRFVEALQRAREHLAAGNVAGQFRQILAVLNHDKNERDAYWDRFVIKKHHRVRFIKTEEVAWIKAAGKGSEIHAGKLTKFVQHGLAVLEKHLNPRQFVRVHRSLMVNRDFIREVQPWFWGTYVLILEDGTKLQTGRGYKARVAQLLEP